MKLLVVVEIAVGTSGVFGPRLTGAGFGGCAVALVAADAAEQAASTITERYRRATGRPGTAAICVPTAGTHVEWVASERRSGFQQDRGGEGRADVVVHRAG